MRRLPSVAELSSAIGVIYDCALDPSGWDTALPIIRDLFEARNAQFVMVDALNGRMLIARSVGVEPYWLEQQKLHFAELSTWPLRPEALSMAPDEAQIGSRHFDAAYLQNSPYMNEWVRPQGLVDGINLNLLYTVTHHAGLGMGRDASRGLFTDRELALARLLSPHLRRAVRISQILDARAAELGIVNATFDSLRFGVILVNDKHRVLWANAAGTQMLSTGRHIVDVDGSLQTNLPTATAELAAAIDLAARDEASIGGTGIAIRLTRPGDKPVLAHVLPVKQRAQRIDAVAAIFVGGVDANGADAMAVAFDLTPSETRLVAGIVAGRTLGESAAALSISENTAKRHLQNVFAKTGVSRQAELVRLAASMVSPAHKSS